MGGKKMPKLPMYEMREDTPWISRNRELNTQAYDLYSNTLDELGQQDQQYYEGIAGKAMQSMWDDYNRNYQKAVNQNLARNYGRTGSTASTSGGYVTDSLQRQYNDAAARLASQGYGMYDQLVNSALNRDLAKLGQYGNAFNTSGKTTEEVDLMNYQTRLKNQDRQWQNDVMRENEKKDWGTVLSNAAQGAAQGSAAGPWGALAGAVVGAAQGYFGQNGYADNMEFLNNIYGNKDKDSNQGGGFDYALIGQLGSQLGSKVSNLFGKTKMSGGQANTFNIA